MMYWKFWFDGRALHSYAFEGLRCEGCAIALPSSVLRVPVSGGDLGGIQRAFALTGLPASIVDAKPDEGEEVPDVERGGVRRLCGCCAAVQDQRNYVVEMSRMVAA